VRLSIFGDQNDQMAGEVAGMSGKGRKAREGMAQRELGLEAITALGQAAPIGQLADELFLCADRADLFFGNERLDCYLSRSGDGWVLRLRELLKELDYTQFYPRYRRHGRKALHPRTLLGLIVYGILMRRGSLRELERLARTDLGAMWLSAGHQPDHSTVGKFINLHRELLAEEFFVKLVNQLARRLHLPVGVTAADGTVIEAATSYRRLRYEAAAIERGGPRASAQPPTPEPDSPEPDGALQPLKNGILRPAYKPSVLASAVLIVGQRVECTSERAALWPMLAQHERALGAAPGALLLDAGYMGIELLTRLAEREINVLCPSGKTSDADWQRRTSGRYFDKREFVYEAQHDRYRCPAGRELHFDYRVRDRRGARATSAIGARNVAIASCARSAPRRGGEGRCGVTPGKRSRRRCRRSCASLAHGASTSGAKFWSSRCSHGCAGCSAWIVSAAADWRRCAQSSRYIASPTTSGWRPTSSYRASSSSSSALLPAVHRSHSPPSHSSY
jgi:transposase